MENVIAIIAARGGSKGIPNKNLVSFCGKPLIYWSIKVALDTPEITGVWVSTDDHTIADYSRQFGASVIERPAHLSGDVIMPDAAWEHAIEVISKNIVEPIDIIVALQNTSPLRETSDLSDAIHKYRHSDCDTMFSCATADDICLWKRNTSGEFCSLNYDYLSRARRQDMEKQFIENGSFYVFTPQTIMQSHDRFFGKIDVFVMDKWKSFEIDEFEDIQLCERLMESYLLQPSV